MSHKKDSLFPFKLVFHSRLVIKRSSLYHAGFFFSFPSKQDRLTPVVTLSEQSKGLQAVNTSFIYTGWKKGLFSPIPPEYGYFVPSHSPLPCWFTSVSCLFMGTSNQFITLKAPTTIQSIFSNSWLILPPPPPKRRIFLTKSYYSRHPTSGSKVLDYA